MKIDYSRVYLRFHSDTPEHIAAMGSYFSRILAPHLPADKSAPIFEIGCGMGFALLALKGLGYTNASGCDSDESQVRSCVAKGLNVQQTEDTQAWLAERPNAFGAILALDLIEHIPVTHQLEFTHQILRSLRPGGRLIGTVPNANSSMASRSRHICFTHHSSFTEHSLDFLLFNAGFNDITITEVEYITRPHNPWLPNGTSRHWWALRFFRLWRRLQMMAELGPAQGRNVPLSMNLLFRAIKSK